MNRSRSAPILAVIAMFLIIAFAAALDLFIKFLREELSRTAQNPFLVLWSYTIGNVLLAGLLLALIVWVLIGVPRTKWVAIVYLFVGLLIGCFPVLYFFMGRFVPGLLISPNSFLFFTGGIVAILGLAILIDPGKKIQNRAYLQK